MSSLKVIKRDNSLQDFDNQKIANAIQKAFSALSVKDDKMVAVLTSCVDEEIHKLHKSEISVADIQDIVERVLMEKGFYSIAKAYVIYRDERDKIRNSKDILMTTIKEMTEHSSQEKDIMRENANINSDTPMGLMLKYGSETAKLFYEKCMMPIEFAHAHESGDIHRMNVAV